MSHWHTNRFEGPCNMSKWGFSIMLSTMVTFLFWSGVAVINKSKMAATHHIRFDKNVYRCWWYNVIPQLWGGGGWGCEVSCGGHHRPRGKTTTGLALDGAVFDITHILAYLVHNMSRSQLYLGFGHFGWLPSFFGQYFFGGLMVKLYFLCWNYSLSSGWHIIAA